MSGPRRLLLDTNVVVGALLWSGPPLVLMEQAVEEGIELVASPALMAELAHTLSYPKFTKRLALLQTDVPALMHRYQSVVTLVEPVDVPRVVPNDADDDTSLPPLWRPRPNSSSPATAICCAFWTTGESTSCVLARHWRASRKLRRHRR